MIQESAATNPVARLRGRDTKASSAYQTPAASGVGVPDYLESDGASQSRPMTGCAVRNGTQRRSCPVLLRTLSGAGLLRFLVVFVVVVSLAIVIKG